MSRPPPSMIPLPLRNWWTLSCEEASWNQVKVLALRFRIRLCMALWGSDWKPKRTSNHCFQRTWVIGSTGRIWWKIASCVLRRASTHLLGQGWWLPEVPLPSCHRACWLFSWDGMVFRFKLWYVSEAPMERQSQSSELSDSKLREMEENLQQENLGRTAEQSPKEQSGCQQSSKRRNQNDRVLVVD